MKTGLQQNAGLRQELKVNPRLYQAMDLLHMPLLDLQQHLKQELLTNPFLELVEPEDEDEDSTDANEASAEAQDLTEPEASAEPEPEKSGDDEVDWEAVLLDGFETGGQREEHEQREFFEPVTVDTRDLSDSRNSCRCSTFRRGRRSSPTSSLATSTTTAIWRVRWTRSSAE